MGVSSGFKLGLMGKKKANLEKPSSIECWSGVDLRYMRYDDCYIMTKDRIKLHGWFIHGGADPTKVPIIPKKLRTLIYFTGNSGHLSKTLKKFNKIVIKFQTNILAVSYRDELPVGFNEVLPRRDTKLPLTETGY